MPFELGDPGVHRAQSRRVDPVQPMSAHRAVADEVDGPQDGEVLGHVGLGRVESIDEIADGRLTCGEDVEDVPAGGFGDRVERIGGGRRTRHADYYMPVWECVKQRETGAGESAYSCSLLQCAQSARRP